MANLILRQRLSETSFALNIALNGVVQEGETATKAVDIYWRWEDEPDSEPQYLASGVAGYPISVPFDPKGREIRLYMISKTETGFASDRNVREAEQIVFNPVDSRPADEAANTVYAGPTSGADAEPTFRALVAADIPSLSGVYQPLDATLTALSGQNWVANALPIGSGADTLSQVSFTANTFPARASTGDLVAKSITDFGLSLVDDADASAARTTLGLVIGTNVQAYDADLTTWAGLTPSANAQSLVTAADYSAMRTLLGLVIGTNVQAYDADLTTWAGITPGTGVGTALAVDVGTAGAFVVNGGALGTPSSGTLTNCTFPTLNQNTTGSAAKWTTARNLAGNSVDGSANVAFANKFIVQGTADSGLSAAQFLGALGTGIVKNTTTTGVLSIAVAGDFPTLNQNTTGSAARLTTARAIYGNNFDGSAALTQIIASTYGGTGNGFAKFSGPATSEKTFTLPNASATILTDNATVTAAQGGTGIASYAIGDLLYASASTTLSKLAGVATGNALISGGVTTAPSWGKIGLTTHVSGTLPIANGGTNATSFTTTNAGVYYDGTRLVTGSRVDFGQSGIALKLIPAAGSSQDPLNLEGGSGVMTIFKNAALDAGWSFGHGTSGAAASTNDLVIQSFSPYTWTERARFTQAGMLKIGGTANRGTTEGTNQLVIFNGTAPVGTLTNGVSLYSASGECRVMDAAGNSTLLSPHDADTNDHIYFSKNTVTGKVLVVETERMWRALDAMLGGGYIHEFDEEPGTPHLPRKDYDKNWKKNKQE